MITSLLHRLTLKAYTRDLLSRTRKVACPRCKAKKGEPCRDPQGRTIAGRHWERADEAKFRGFLCGKWYRDGGVGVTFIDHDGNVVVEWKLR